MHFLPFTAWLFDDPNRAENDGVLDVSTVICNVSDIDRRPPDGRTYDVRRLRQDPELTAHWFDQGILVRDSVPAMYLYRLGYSDHRGQPMQCSAVWGAVGCPTELTLTPALASPAPRGFSELLHPTGLPLVRATDDYGNHHRLWRLTQTGVTTTIADALKDSDIPDPAEGLCVASETDFETPVDHERTLGDLVGVGLVLLPGTVQT